MLKQAQDAIKKFHVRFLLPVAQTPTMLQSKRAQLRARWIQEETTELLNAADIVDQVDAAVDLIYFAIGILVEMGVDGSAAFQIVHEANMNKLGQDDNPLYDESGKVMKPESWISPKKKIREWLSNLT